VGGWIIHPPVERADPNFASDIRILYVGCEDGWSLTYLKTGCPDDFTFFFLQRKGLPTPLASN